MPIRKIAGSVTLYCLAIFVVTVGGVRAESGPQVTSKYTSTARSKSLSFKDYSKIPEGGFEAVFAGLGGYKLVHLSGDERSSINIQFGDKTADLYSATMEAGGGTFPHKANDVVEWRGVEEKGRFVPYAIIYRLAAGNDDPFSPFADPFSPFYFWWTPNHKKPEFFPKIAQICPRDAKRLTREKRGYFGSGLLKLNLFHFVKRNSPEKPKSKPGTLDDTKPNFNRRAGYGNLFYCAIESPDALLLRPIDLRQLRIEIDQVPR